MHLSDAPNKVETIIITQLTTHLMQCRRGLQPHHERALVALVAGMEARAPYAQGAVLVGPKLLGGTK